MDTNELKEKTVLVLGAGKTGIATSRFLIGKVKNILLSECKAKLNYLNNEINDLSSHGVKFEFNKNSDDFLKQADLIIISPGISPQSEIVKKINNLNKPIISDIELGKYFTKKPVIAVTGTNGKTTTTSLITHLINSSGKKAVSCGNIGNPFLEVLNKEEENIDFYVLEISSYQIYYSPDLSCEIAVCLNITPDHLDWHGNLNHYIETKKKLFYGQKSNSWSVLNYSDPVMKSFRLKNNIFYFSYNLLNQNQIKDLPYLAYFENNILKLKEKNNICEIINKNELNILGGHNIENSLASIAVAKIINLSNKDIKDSLKTFKGVEHRLEHIRNLNGKSFYNDSKATNPEATIRAIESFIGKKITLILGGRDKKTNLSNMIDIIKRHVSEVILFGEAKERFYNELNKSNFKQVKIVNDLSEAISASLCSESDIILFSPACSSFDMFKNYEERGEIFKELVCKLSSH
ncbi:MAG: UDP-N-acetylmuramoyl-L-alanine--D-glutamate ligase [Candidatus Melainabacteria bacterium]|nr:UDP-N-acetylmuramoyl-L-alanine--D-glutamate ligase [Candidatus Melainabacteria bacterium]